MVTERRCMHNSLLIHPAAAAGWLNARTLGPQVTIPPSSYLIYGADRQVDATLYFYSIAQPHLYRICCLATDGERGHIQREIGADDAVSYMSQTSRRMDLTMADTSAYKPYELFVGIHGCQLWLMGVCNIYTFAD